MAAMADRKEFDNAVAAINRETKEEVGAFVARLKTLTPAEFVRLPREDLERLSISQYLNIARVIAPDVTPLTATPVRAAKPPQEIKKLKRPWPTGQLSSLAVAAGVTLGVTWALWGTALLAAIDMAPIVRSSYVSDWPRCTRLASDTDGCVYLAGQDLPWTYASAMLGLDVETLRRSNTHLPADRVPQGSRLVVWRFRGTLED